MRKVYSVGCVVTLDNTQPGAWKIEMIVTEDIHERTQSDVSQECGIGLSDRSRTGWRRCYCVYWKMYENLYTRVPSPSLH